MSYGHWDADMRFALRRNDYHQCERCGRIIYEDDGYHASDYGGFLCEDCYEDMNYDYEDEKEIDE